MLTLGSAPSVAPPLTPKRASRPSRLGGVFSSGDPVSKVSEDRSLDGDRVFRLTRRPPFMDLSPRPLARPGLLGVQSCPNSLQGQQGGGVRSERRSGNARSPRGARTVWRAPTRSRGSPLGWRHMLPEFSW
jgi:hypothetical protein